MEGWDFVDYWYLGLAIAAVVVLLVAVLLLLIIATAREILATVTRALAVANEIVANTQPIWALDTTNRVAVDLLDGTEAIAQHAREIATALEAPALQV